MNIREEPPVYPKSVENMFALIRAAFAQRRKTFSNAVRAVSSKYSKEDIENALISLGLPADVRGENSDFANMLRFRIFCRYDKSKT